MNEFDDPFGEESPGRVWRAAPSEQTGGGGAPAENLDAIAEALANPLSYLWMAFMQNDTIWYDGDIADALGEDAKTQNTFMFNPVLSMQLTDEWKMVFRPVIPINSFETLDNVNITTTNPGRVTGVDFQRETGIGDIVLWTAFSKQYTPPIIFGFGPTLMLDTASDDFLGTGKNSAGPMVLAFKISEKWILGVIAQHWWSFSGSNTIKVQTNAGVVRVESPDVNLTDIQPVIRYRVSAKTNIGMAPNWRYNHETNQASIPIGIGFDTLVTFGKLPVKIGLEAYYYIESEPQAAGRYTFTFKDVPVDAFWSVTIYNRDGYLEPNPFDSHNRNSMTSAADLNGIVTLNLSPDGEGLTNHLYVMDGWNYALRLYKPHQSVIDKTWRPPTPQPVG